MISSLGIGTPSKNRAQHLSSEAICYFEITAIRLRPAAGMLYSLCVAGRAAMRLGVPVAGFLALAGLALFSGPAAIAASPLDETYWESDDNCFILDLYLHSNGSAEIE